MLTNDMVKDHGNSCGTLSSLSSPCFCQNDRKKKPSKASGGIDGVCEGQMDGSDPLMPEDGSEPGSGAGRREEEGEDDNCVVSWDTQ